MILQKNIEVCATGKLLTHLKNGLYDKIGFVKEYDLKPDYFYVIGDKRKHKFNFRGKNEKNKMSENKIYRIYDAGKIKYKFNSNYLHKE